MFSTESANPPINSRYVPRPREGFVQQNRSVQRADAPTLCALVCSAIIRLRLFVAAVCLPWEVIRRKRHASVKDGLEPCTRIAPHHVNVVIVHRQVLDIVVRTYSNRIARGGHRVADAQRSAEGLPAILRDRAPDIVRAVAIHRAPHQPQHAVPRELECRLLFMEPSAESSSCPNRGEHDRR